MTKAILARHAESELSLAGLTNGVPSLAAGLTATGREQARRLGERLPGEPLDLCVVSEFQRARETAELALAGRDVARLVLPQLNDVRFGEFEGRAIADYRAWAHSHGPEEPAPGGGESRAAAVARYADGYRTILKRAEETVLVVAHGLPVRYALDAAAGGDPVPAVRQVPYAEPFRLTNAELAAAVERLEQWAAHPSWTRS